jgi:hypothetical protein
MAQMNDNWLVGQPQRTRGHFPIPVKIKVSPDDVEWRGEKPVASVTFRKADDEYLPVYLTQGDVDALLTNLWTFASKKTHQSLATAVLTSLSNSDLLASLQQVFDGRNR